MTKPISDERLAEIRAWQDAPRPPYQRTVSAGVVPELLDEIDRLRAILSRRRRPMTDDPMLEDVREWYIIGRRTHDPFNGDAHLIERFDRWLVEHDREKDDRIQVLEAALARTTLVKLRGFHPEGDDQ